MPPCCTDADGANFGWTVLKVFVERKDIIGCKDTPEGAGEGVTE